MLIQRLFQTVLISTVVAFVVPAAASPALPLCGDEKAATDGKDDKKKNDKKDAKKDDGDAPA